MFSGIGFGEMLVIGIVAVLLFGRRLPEVARNAGSAYREFRKQVSELQRTFTEIDLEAPPKKTSPTVVDVDDDEPDEPASPRFIPPPAEESG